MPGFDMTRKQLVVAMDHGRALGAVAGLEDPGRVIDPVIEAGADAIMTSFGVVKRYRERLIGRIPTLLRLDGGPSRYREDWLEVQPSGRLLHTVEDARALGVDGVCTMVFMGGAVELETLEITAEVAGECLRRRPAADGRGAALPERAHPRSERCRGDGIRLPARLRARRRRAQDLRDRQRRELSPGDRRAARRRC